MHRDVESSNALVSAQLGALSLRVLVKTILKSVLWFGLAWLITLFVPGALWPWYVAWTFVAVGLAFSLLSLCLAFASRWHDARNPSS